MAFEDSSQAGTSSSRYLGAGFRQEPDFRDGATAPATPATAVAVPEQTTVTLTKRSTPNLEYVFDDPAEGEPGRDRMLVHGLWELVLVLAVAGLGFLLHRAQPAAFTGTGIRGLLLSGSVVGLLGMAMALSLRAGAANLSVGVTAVASGLYVATHAGGALVPSLLAAVGLAAAVGAVVGVVVVGLHVPGWAASLGAALVLVVWTGRQTGVAFDGYDPVPHAYWWFGAFALVSVVSGVVGLVPTVRRGLGRFRPVADPADRRGGVAAGITFAALVLSGALAGLAGVLSVAVDRAAAPSDGLNLTAVALGVALLGGTSAYGRRGGIFGTVFATAVLVIGVRYATPSWPVAGLAAAAIGVGLVVTRLVERFGRPAPARSGEDSDDDWVPRVHSAPTGAARTQSTQTAIGGIWASEDAWGTTERR